MSLEPSTEQLVRQRHGLGRSARRSWVLAALIVSLGGSGAGRAAAAEAAGTPSWLQLETDLTVSREMLDTRWSSLVRPPSSAPDYSLAAAQQQLSSWNALSKVPSLIEVSPAHVAASNPQLIVAPQFALGGSSDSLRSWLRFAGIDASHCMAPLMKMHSSFAGSTSHANVSVSARCSLH